MTLLCAILGLALGVRALWGRLVGADASLGLRVAQSAKTNLNIVIQIAMGAVAVFDLLTRQRSAATYYSKTEVPATAGTTSAFTRPAGEITAD